MSNTQKTTVKPGDKFTMPVTMEEQMTRDGMQVVQCGGYSCVVKELAVPGMWNCLMLRANGTVSGFAVQPESELLKFWNRVE